MLFKWLTEATRTRGSAKALVYRDTYLSWRGLSHRVERRVQEFRAMGIGDGQWVGLMLGNVPDFAILALALSRLGATVVPLDPTTGGRDLSLIMEYAPLRGLITRPRGGVESGLQAASAAMSSTAPSVGRMQEGLESRRRLQGTLLTCSIYKKPQKAPGDAAVVLFTNDSSGDPKGVLRTDENLEHGAVQTAKALDVTPEDRILTTVPLYHAYGFDLGLVLALRFGATLYLEDEVAPKRIVKLLRDQEIDFLPGTPGLYAGLAKLPTAKPLKIKGARYFSAGSTLPEATAEVFKNRLGIRILPMYHTTETGTVACDRKPAVEGTLGKAIDGVEVRVGDGKRPAGEAGPIWVKSKAIARDMVGPSAQAPSRSNKKDAHKDLGLIPVGGIDGNGWLRTGDVGHLDKTGRIFLAGREDQLVKVDGKRVALGEVEGCLESFPKVQRAQVRVITNPLGGPMVVASVVVLGKCGAEEIIDHCAKNLASYKVPRRIVFCEELPRLMGRTRLALAVVAGLATACKHPIMDGDAGPGAADAGSMSVPSGPAQHNLDALNMYRSQNGAGALVLDDKLNQFAADGTAALAAGGAPHAHFMQASSNGSIWSAGFCSGAAENQAPHWKGADENSAIDAILAAMMGEGPGGGHHDNIIDPKWTRVGVGLLTQSDGLYLTNDFSPPCP